MNVWVFFVVLLFVVLSYAAVPPLLWTNHTVRGKTGAPKNLLQREGLPVTNPDVESLKKLKFMDGNDALRSKVLQVARQNCIGGNPGNTLFAMSKYISCWVPANAAPRWTIHFLTQKDIDSSQSQATRRYKGWYVDGVNNNGVQLNGNAFTQPDFPRFGENMDRGHLVPNHDTDGQYQEETFMAFNRAPQHDARNQYFWRCCEEGIRKFLKSSGVSGLLIFTVVDYGDDDTFTTVTEQGGSTKIAVASRFTKYIFKVDKDNKIYNGFRVTLAHDADWNENAKSRSQDVTAFPQVLSLDASPSPDALIEAFQSAVTFEGLDPNELVPGSAIKGILFAKTEPTSFKCWGPEPGCHDIASEVKLVYNSKSLTHRPVGWWFSFPTREGFKCSRTCAAMQTFTRVAITSDLSFIGSEDDEEKEGITSFVEDSCERTIAKDLHSLFLDYYRLQQGTDYAGVQGVFSTHPCISSTTRNPPPPNNQIPEIRAVVYARCIPQNNNKNPAKQARNKKKQETKGTKYIGDQITPDSKTQESMTERKRTPKKTAPEPNSNQPSSAYPPSPQSSSPSKDNTPVPFSLADYAAQDIYDDGWVTKVNQVQNQLIKKLAYTHPNPNANKPLPSPATTPAKRLTREQLKKLKEEEKQEQALRLASQPFSPQSQFGKEQYDKFKTKNKKDIEDDNIRYSTLSDLDNIATQVPLPPTPDGKVEVVILKETRKEKEEKEEKKEAQTPKRGRKGKQGEAQTPKNVKGKKAEAQTPRQNPPRAVKMTMKPPQTPK